jgi:hypothetical protein
MPVLVIAGEKSGGDFVAQVRLVADDVPAVEGRGPLADGRSPAGVIPRSSTSSAIQP